MRMTDNEILRSYREAKNPKDQIQVLADLNCVSKWEIVSLLRNMGVDGRLLPKQKKPKSEKSIPLTDHIEVLMTALQMYKQSIMDELEVRVNAADATCQKIDAALEFIKESVRG